MTTERDVSVRKEGEMIKDTSERSLVKTLSYRLCATSISAVMLLIITGSLPLAVLIGATDIVVKSGLYYLHERAWSRAED